MDTPGLGPISRREAEVLAALGEHRSNAQIANRLRISVRTVESHVSSLLRKLGAADRRALAAIAGPRPQEPPPGTVTGIPHGRTTFVGRRADHDAVVAALADGRLVSLMGPGGMGKTRLAAVVAGAVAAAFPAGAAFVDLVPVRPGQVALAVAGALGVSERPPQPLERTITGWLKEGRFLLVLDNCEHVVDDVADLAAMVQQRCPNTTILATTRRRLAVPGEQVVRLGPLPAEPDAVRLFFDRARAVDADLDIDPATVASICRDLDGMPLAIEIAAARAASLGREGLRAAAGDRLRLASGTRGVHPRHSSLSAVMAWSYDLLDAEEQAALRALSVFTGSFDLAAAAAVTGVEHDSAVADVVGRLADGSLVVRDGRFGRGRWRLLETVRAFAGERLVAAEDARVRQRHVAWAAATAVRLRAELGDGGRLGFATVAADLRAAAASTAPGPDATAHALAVSLATVTFACGFNGEAREHFAAAADRAPDAHRAGRDLCAAASAATAVYDGPAAFDLYLAAAKRCRAAGLAGDAAAATACAVITALRFPGEFRRRLTPEGGAHLLETAVREADPADGRTAALIAAARAWNEGSDGTDLAGTALDLARAHGDPLLLLGALDVAMTGPRRRDEVGGFVAERLRLVAGLPRHDPAAATEITDTFHVAASHALATGDLPAAEAVLETAARQDPLAGHPYVTVPRRIRLAVLLGRFGEALIDAEVLWDEWRRDGAPTRRWMATAVALAALAEGLRDEKAGAHRRERAPDVAETDDRSCEHAPYSADDTSGSREPWREAPENTTGPHEQAAVDARHELPWEHVGTTGSHEGWREHTSLGAVDTTDSHASRRERAPRTHEDTTGSHEHAAADRRSEPLFGDATGSHEGWRERALEIAQTDDVTGSHELAACMAFVDARLAVHTGRLADAEAMVGRAFASFEDESVVPHPAAGGRVWEGYARAAAAELAVVAGLPTAADLLAAASRHADDNQWAAACLARARGRLTGEPGHLADAAARWGRIAARFERACTLVLMPDHREEGRAELEALQASSPAC